MSDDAPVVASAVANPEPKAHSPTGNKRSRSLSPEAPTKRVRTEDEQNTPEVPAATESTGATQSEPRDAPARKQSTRDDERKRGKRLFGGMLGILSGGQTQQKKWRIQDPTQQENMRKEAKQQSEEVRKREYAQLMEARKKEQTKYNRELLQRKHAMKRTTARFLKTKTEPHIYYSPRRLTRDQEAMIDEQIARVNDEIQEELQALDESEHIKQPLDDTKAEKHDEAQAGTSNDTKPKELSGGQATASANPAYPPAEAAAVAPSAPDAPAPSAELRHPDDDDDDEYKDDHEEEAEVNGEDTVIY